eukprot:9681610-Heterocapsa_arctica.AAC.1
MYGFRDASSGRMEDWQKLLGEAGYVVGMANPALFLNPEKDSRGAFRGDDFYVLGNRAAIDHIAGVFFLGERIPSEDAILNRVVTPSTLGHDGGHDGGRRYVQLEHVDLIIRSMGHEGATAKPAATPR